MQDMDLTNIRNLIQKNQTSRAIDLLREKEASGALNDAEIQLLADASLAHARYLLSQNHMQESLPHLQTATDCSPRSYEAHFLAGAVNAQLGNFDQALKHTDSALRVNPNNTDALYNKAQLHMHLEETDYAVDAYRTLLDIDEDHPHAHGNLAILLHQQKRYSEAEVHYRRAIELKPDVDAYKYGLAGIMGEAIPAEHVRKLFDDGAEKFDSLLVDELDYKTPGHISKLLEKYTTRTNYNVLDLGCGTGLSGQAVSDFSATITGVDISPGMLGKAASKKIYNQLVEGEILHYMRNSDTGFDLIIASDVFNYIGNLSDVFKQCHRLLLPGGMFVFSIESEGNSGYHMDVKNLRYTHSEKYITDLAARARFSVTETQHAVLRKNYGVPVDGTIYLLESPTT